MPFPKKGVAQFPGSKSKIDINASSAQRPEALSEDNLRVRVQQIVLYGTVQESWHSKKDRSYRNVSMDDIQHMLRSEWKLAGKPKWSDEHRNWTYKLEGEDLDDDELTLIIAVKDEQLQILVITKY